jgi:23S rRNA (uracil1939-C5)-methyltransferase
MTDFELNAELTIARLGQRGEGLARRDGDMVAVPYALPGETIRAEIDGERARMVDVLTPSRDRTPAFCPYFTICGGCAVQTLAWPAYADWKRGLVVEGLSRAKIETAIAPLVDAHGAGRRRATFHASVHDEGAGRKRLELGFMQARAHAIVSIDHCPILDPAMKGAIEAAREAATVLIPLEKPLDIVVTATLEGLDVDLRGSGPLDFGYRQALITVATRRDLARISNHGEIIIERRAPTLQMGKALVALPPGGFLQATAAGEEALARLVREGVGASKKIADLFAGSGTFALRLAEKAEVLAVEGDAHALRALARAAGHTQGIRHLKAEHRNLYTRPLMAGELDAFDAVVFDPPRAGAEAQAKALAISPVPVVVGVSCNVQTFARDARILIDGGYALEKVTPVDQFRHSAHVELVGVFRKAPPAKTKRRGRLLG